MVPESARMLPRASHSIFHRVGLCADHLPPAYGICPARGGIIGERVFRDHCATCHQAHGLGFAVGPDLGAEFQRAEEAILKDILAPNETISAGYPTYVIETAAGLTLNGILASESAISITLRLAAGAEQVVLRKDIARFESMSVSLMPEALATTLEPKDVADVITFLRDRGENQQSAATNRIVLFDEEAEFITRLGEGDGRATFETNGAFSGYAFFALTPPQRYSGSIPGWNFHITEKRRRRRVSLPAPGVENPGRAGGDARTADNGRWPAAESPQRRYFAGKNLTQWAAREVSLIAPDEWRVVTFDLWKDNGAFTLTGIAPTVMGGTVFFDRIELLRDLGIATSASAER